MDDPTAEVAALVAAYDAALAAGDLDAVDACFWEDDRTVRVGERGVLRGHASIAAARRAGAAPAEGRLDERLDVVAIGDDVAVALLTYRRPSGVPGRRTQVWWRTSAGWRIVHAHLSVEPPPATGPGA